MHVKVFINTTRTNSFLKFYVMGSPQIDLYDIAHVKVDFIALQKMYVIPMLGRFVWTTSFVQCVRDALRDALCDALCDAKV